MCTFAFALECPFVGRVRNWDSEEGDLAHGCDGWTTFTKDPSDAEESFTHCSISLDG